MLVQVVLPAPPFMNDRGLLLLWNDIDASVDAEYNRWHALEHVPERMTVPGILAGRRYARVEKGLQHYLTVYELESTAVLASPAYLSLANNPTPWSKRMRNYFDNVTRTACHRHASAGAGIGACLVTIPVESGLADESSIANVLAAAVAIEGMVAAHWCQCDHQAPALTWQASAPAARHDQILIVEATDVAALRAARNQLEQLARYAAPGSASRCGPEYALLQVVRKN
jgi:hypothetical protein